MSMFRVFVGMFGKCSSMLHEAVCWCGARAVMTLHKHSTNADALFARVLGDFVPAWLSSVRTAESM